MFLFVSWMWFLEVNTHSVKKIGQFRSTMSKLVFPKYLSNIFLILIISLSKNTVCFNKICFTNGTVELSPFSIAIKHWNLY